MSKNLKKKSRIGLSAAAGLLAASGSIAPLTMSTSCNENKAKTNVIDKEYGVTKETYEDLKEQFRLEYSQKLVKIYDVKSEDYKIRMEALEQDLSNLDKVANSRKTSYTALTQVLVDFAREHNQKYPTGNATETEPYGIRLTRHTRTKWSDLNDLYAGMADSFKTYMHNSKMPASTINRIMVESKAKFDNLIKQLKATYGNDALAGLIQAKEKVITFFDEVNEEIALISACLRLKDFISEFVFEYKDYNNDGSFCRENRLDVLEQDVNFKVNNILTNDLMNKIFTVTRKTTGETVEFDANSIVPGYVIQPKLTKISEDLASNTYSISVDFGLVKNVYVQKYAKDPKKLASLTAHMYNLNAESLKPQTLDDNITIADFLRSMPAKSLEYIVRLTPQEEAKRLEQFYFNHDSKHGSISFNWTNDKSKQAYEAFFDNARQDKNNPNKWTGTLSTQSLVNAGLTISCDGKKYTLISEGDEKHDSFLSNDYNLQGKFLKNCALLSDVEIIEGNQKVVNHSLKAVYANSIYDSKVGGESPLFSVKPFDYNSQCIDFKISNAFYEKINDKFNDIAHFVLVYNATLKNASESQNELSDEDEAKLQKLEDEADELFASETIALVTYGITLGLSICSICSAITSSKSKFWLWFGIIVNILIIGLQSANYALFMTKYYKQVKDDAKKVRNAQKEMDNSSLLEMLMEDLDEYFVLINEDETYNEVKFASQKAKFEKNSMADMLNIYRKYSTINQYDSKDQTANTEAQNANKEFNDILSKNNITVDDVEKDVKEWRPGGKYFIATFIVSLGVIVLNFVSILIYDLYVSKQQPGEPENKISQANDESILISADANEGKTKVQFEIEDITKSLKNNDNLKNRFQQFKSTGSEKRDIAFREIDLPGEPLFSSRQRLLQAFYDAIMLECRKIYLNLMEEAKAKKLADGSPDYAKTTEIYNEYCQVHREWEDTITQHVFNLKNDKTKFIQDEFSELDSDSIIEKLEKILS